MKNSTLGIFSEIYNNKKKLKSLTAMAERQLRRNGVDVLAQYMTPEDLIFEIAVGVLTGSIKWNRERVPDLHNFIYHQLRSILANIQRKELNNQVVYRSWYESLPTPARRKFESIQANEEEEDMDLPGISLEEVMKEQEYLDIREFVQKKLEPDVLAYFAFEDKLSGYDTKSSARNLKLTDIESKRARDRADKVISKIAKLLREDEKKKE